MPKKFNPFSDLDVVSPNHMFIKLAIPFQQNAAWKMLMRLINFLIYVKNFVFYRFQFKNTLTFGPEKIALNVLKKSYKEFKKLPIKRAEEFKKLLIKM